MCSDMVRSTHFLSIRHDKWSHFETENPPININLMHYEHPKRVPNQNEQYSQIKTIQIDQTGFKKLRFRIAIQYTGS